MSVVCNVPVIHLKRFEIPLGALDFASLLRELQLGFILSAFRFANESQNHTSPFTVANDAPVWIVVPDHLRKMYLKCRGKLEVEENLCVRSQAVFHEQHLYLRNPPEPDRTTLSHQPQLILFGGMVS